MKKNIAPFYMGGGTNWEVKFDLQKFASVNNPYTSALDGKLEISAELIPPAPGGTASYKFELYTYTDADQIQYLGYRNAALGWSLGNMTYENNQISIYFDLYQFTTAKDANGIYSLIVVITKQITTKYRVKCEVIDIDGSIAFTYVLNWSKDIVDNKYSEYTVGIDADLYNWLRQHLYNAFTLRVSIT